MARKEITKFFDDIDGTELGESEINIVQFSLDGKNYVIDLSESNATKFRETLAPYIEVARKQVASRGGQRRSPGNNNTRGRTRKIREWAKDQGMNVASRGQLSTEIVEAYDAAH